MGGVLPFIGLGAQVLGTGLKVLGGIGGALSGRQQADYQARVARNNENIARWNSYNAKQQGEVAATNEGLKGRAVVGAIAAAQGASGIDMNSGSAVSVRADAASLAQLNAMTIKSDAARRAYGYDIMAKNYHAEAKLAKASKPTILQSILGIGSSVLGSAGSIGKEAYAMDQQGLFGPGGESFGTPLADIGGPAAGLLQPGMIGTTPGIY